MAISQIGNITHINQNTLLNSQLQANALNTPNLQSAINIQEFSDKIKENMEVRKAEGVESINKDSSSKNKQDMESREDSKKEDIASQAQKKPHVNDYTKHSDGIMLDIEV